MPVRQWVLSLPIPLRLLRAAPPELVTPVLQVVQRALRRLLLDQARLKADNGAVVLIQRLGSAANLNVYLRCLVLDGVYWCGADGEAGVVKAPALSLQRMAALVPRPRRHLIRFGVRITLLREVSRPPPREHGAGATNAKLRPSWAKLLKRVFEIGSAHGPNCSGELKIIVALLAPPVIEKALTHPGLQAQAWPRAPARRRPSVATASGLRPSCQQVSGGAVPGATGIGCAAVSPR